MDEENISKMKREPTIWEIYLPVIPQTRVLSTKYIQNSHNYTLATKNKKLKNGQT